MTSIPGFTPMTPIEDPLARRAFFVAYEGMGLPSPRQAEATFVSGPVTVTMAGRVRSSSTGRLGRMNFRKIEARALNCSATRRKLPADFSRSPLEILGGPQSRFPHPVGSGVLGVDPMPGGKLFQSFDCFQRVFGHQCDLLNSTIWFGVALRQTVAISVIRRTLLRSVSLFALA